jgi:carbohydrate diacid regulator
LQWDKRHKEELVLQLIRGEGQADQLQQVARFLELDRPAPGGGRAGAGGGRARQVRELVHLLEPERDNLVAINGLDEIVVLKPAQLSDGVWRSAQGAAGSGCCSPVFPISRFASGWVITSPASLGWRSLDGANTLRRGMRQSPRKQVYFFEDYRLSVLLGTLADSWQADQLRAPLQKLAQEDTKERCKRRCANISCRIVICIPVPKPCSFTPTPCVID